MQRTSTDCVVASHSGKPSAWKSLSRPTVASLRDDVQHAQLVDATALREQPQQTAVQVGVVADLLLLPLIALSHAYRQERVHVVLQMQHHAALLRLLAVHGHSHVRLHHHAAQHLAAQLARLVHAALHRQHQHAVAREIDGAHPHARHATRLEQVLRPHVASLQLDHRQEARDLVEEAEEDAVVAQLLHHAHDLVALLRLRQVAHQRRVLAQQRALVGADKRVLVRNHAHHAHTQLLPHRKRLARVLHRRQLAHVFRIQHSANLSHILPSSLHSSRWPAARSAPPPPSPSPSRTGPASRSPPPRSRCGEWTARSPPARGRRSGRSPARDRPPSSDPP